MGRPTIITDTVTELLKRTGRRVDPQERKKIGKRLYRQMIDGLLQMDPAQLQLLATGSTGMESSYLRGLAHSCAENAVRNQCPDDLRDGLIALIAENATFDFRETLMKLCLLNHSATKLGVDLRVVFEAVCHVGSPNIVELIRDYLSHGEKDLRAMRFREVSDADGFRYESTWT